MNDLILLPDNKLDEPYILISAGTYEQDSVDNGKGITIIEFLNSITLELTYYFQWVNGLELTEQEEKKQAKREAIKIVEKYYETEAPTCLNDDQYWIIQFIIGTEKYYLLWFGADEDEKDYFCVENEKLVISKEISEIFEYAQKRKFNIVGQEIHKDNIIDLNYKNNMYSDGELDAEYILTIWDVYDVLCQSINKDIVRSQKQNKDIFERLRHSSPETMEEWNMECIQQNWSMDEIKFFETIMENCCKMICESK